MALPASYRVQNEGPIETGATRSIAVNEERGDEEKQKRLGERADCKAEGVGRVGAGAVGQQLFSLPIL